MVAIFNTTVFGLEQHIGSVALGALSPTSTCHTFDESADGYGRADAVGALYIKRLSDAVQNGDPLRAIIRGTAVNTSVWPGASIMRELSVANVATEMEGAQASVIQVFTNKRPSSVLPMHTPN